jgi:hypothetical protein
MLIAKLPFIPIKEAETKGCPFAYQHNSNNEWGACLAHKCMKWQARSDVHVEKRFLANKVTVTDSETHGRCGA